MPRSHWSSPHLSSTCPVLPSHLPIADTSQVSHKRVTCPFSWNAMTSPRIPFSQAARAEQASCVCPALSWTAFQQSPLSPAGNDLNRVSLAQNPSGTSPHPRPLCPTRSACQRCSLQASGSHAKRRCLHHRCCTLPKSTLRCHVPQSTLLHLLPGLPFHRPVHRFVWGLLAASPLLSNSIDHLVEQWRATTPRETWLHEFNRVADCRVRSQVFLRRPHRRSLYLGRMLPQ